MIYTQEQLEVTSDVQLDAIIFECKFGAIGSDKDMKRVWDSGKISYCNNWADMGTLIEEIWDHLQAWEMDTERSVWERMIDICNGKILRAAAIVYILIKQGE